MNLNIKTLNMSLTPDIESYLERKLRMLGRIIDWDSDNVFVQAELGKTTDHHRQGNIFRAEINVRYGGRYIRAVSEKEDLYSAIDEMKDELSRELKHTKGKRFALVRRGAIALKNMVKGIGGRDRRRDGMN
jgi:ribosomal subunit interface protein